MAATLGVKVHLESPQKAAPTVSSAPSDASIAKVVVSPHTKPPIEVTTESSYENELIAELNLVRADPAGYASKLEALKCHFQGNVYHPPGTNSARGTKEGAEAFDDAVTYLRTAQPSKALTVNKEFSRSCADLV